VKIALDDLQNESANYLMKVTFAQVGLF